MPCRTHEKGRAHMKLKELLAGIPVLSATADLELEIPGVCYDSRAVRPGDLFVAMTGFAADGHAFIPQARCRCGGRAVPKIPARVRDVQVADSRRGAGCGGGQLLRPSCPEHDHGSGDGEPMERPAPPTSSRLLEQAVVQKSA